jgi:hypothetical protein
MTIAEEIIAGMEAVMPVIANFQAKTSEVPRDVIARDMLRLMVQRGGLSVEEAVTRAFDYADAFVAEAEKRAPKPQRPVYVVSTPTPSPEPCVHAVTKKDAAGIEECVGCKAIVGINLPEVLA